MMLIGIYMISGDALVLPLDQAAQRIGKSEYFIRECLESRKTYPGGVITKVPPDTPLRGSNIADTNLTAAKDSAGQLYMDW